MWRICRGSLIGIALLAVAATNAQAHVDESHSSSRSFTMGHGARKLIVDNISGHIEVTGYDGDSVQASIDEHWRADNSEKMAEAHRDVRLDATQSGDQVRFYVDGPFRCHDHGDCGHHGRLGYDVAFDFRICVPRDAVLDLKTVNGSIIRVDGSAADFDVSNVNGRIQLTGMQGVGKVRTVNGGVNVAFSAVPRSACEFRTVNGSIEVAFPESISADLSLRTVNGALYTDFDAMRIGDEAADGRREGTKYVFKMRNGARLRIAGGGPEHKFETVNGSITVSKAGRG